MSAELRLRIISALVMAAVVLAATWLGGLAFSVVAVIIAGLVFYEWTTITGQRLRDRHTLFCWIGLAMVLAELLIPFPGHGFFTSFVLLLGFTLVSLLISLARRHDFWLTGGLFYAGLSGVSLAALRGNNADGLVTILFLFAVVWATDIMAYFVGRSIGGRKLAPSISPGKTWSGAAGGTFFGIVGGCLVAWLAGQPLSILLVAITAILSIGSQIGDLFESFIKRRFGVKDSSHLIPGHGGVMDRVDGLVFASFLAFLGALAMMAVSGQFFLDAGHLATG
jgi:phosphatidate cytidylyltransferase